MLRALQAQPNARVMLVCTEVGAQISSSPLLLPVCGQVLTPRCCRS